MRGIQVFITLLFSLKKQAFGRVTHRTQLLVFLFMLLVTLSFTLTAQRVYVPKVVDNEYLFPHPTSEKNVEIPHQDTTMLRIQIPNLDYNMALYVGNADYNVLKLSDTTLYLGRYVKRSFVQDKEDDVHFEIDKSWANQYATLTSYSISNQPYFIDLMVLPLEKAKANKSDMISRNYFGMFMSVFFIGGVFIMFIYSSGNYLLSSMRDFKYFAFYLLALLIHNGLQTDSYLRIFKLFPENPIFYHQVIDGLNMFTYTFYIYFITQFLNYKKYNPQLLRLMNLTMTYFLICSTTIMLVGLITSNLVLTKLMMQILFTGASLLCLILIILTHRFGRSPNNPYAIIGSYFLLTCILIEILFSHYLHSTPYWDMYEPIFKGFIPSNFTHFGNFLVILFYSMAIGLKYKRNDSLLVDFQNKEISTLKQETERKKKNLQLLQKDFAQKQNQQSQQEELFQGMKNEFGNIKTNLNPIYISNLLQSINNNIVSNKNKLVKEQINVFNKFIENILKHSLSKVVSLKTEMNNIEYFLELEKIRILENFKYKINLKGSDQLNDIKLPPFLLQPYLEYIMWHIDTEETPRIAILFSEKNENVHIQVDCKNNLEIDSDKLNEITELMRSKLSKNLSQSEERVHIQFEPILSQTSDKRSLIISFPSSIQA